MKTNKALIALGIMLSSFVLTGCIAAVAGAAYVVGEEVNEDDGDFDPLDEVVDG